MQGPEVRGQNAEGAGAAHIQRFQFDFCLLNSAFCVVSEFNLIRGAILSTLLGSDLE